MCDLVFALRKDIKVARKHFLDNCHQIIDNKNMTLFKFTSVVTAAILSRSKKTDLISFVFNAECVTNYCQKYIKQRCIKRWHDPGNHLVTVTWKTKFISHTPPVGLFHVTMCLFQNESSRKTFHMKMSWYALKWTCTHFLLVLQEHSFWRRGQRQPESFIKDITSPILSNQNRQSFQK